MALVQLLLDYRCWIDGQGSDGRSGPAGSLGGAMGLRYPPEVQTCLKKISDMTPQQVRGTGLLTRATVWEPKLDSDLSAGAVIFAARPRAGDAAAGAGRTWVVGTVRPMAALETCAYFAPSRATSVGRVTWTSGRPGPRTVSHSVVTHWRCMP